ncbi:unnamed protein product [Prorocentrum cordatum]|uniref:Uncharacterized protein n=1 Tax=Prorocentrum cordatum TaxID=2364126 RepID=A0ABN9UX74_9DINO|nr:unnamed protein product [Polarella glacialis]
MPNGGPTSKGAGLDEKMKGATHQEALYEHKRWKRPQRKALMEQNELANRRDMAFERARIPAIDPEEEQGSEQVKGKGKIMREPAKSQQSQRKVFAQKQAIQLLKATVRRQERASNRIAVLSEPMVWNQAPALTTTLPNGVRVVTKEGFGDLASVGVFLDAGVRDETKDLETPWAPPTSSSS